MHQSIGSGGRGGWELTEVKGEGEEEKGEDRSAWGGGQREAEEDDPERSTHVNEESKKGGMEKERGSEGAGRGKVEAEREEEMKENNSSRLTSIQNI